MSRHVLKHLLISFYIANIIKAEPVVTLGATNVTYNGTVFNSIEHFHHIKYAHDTSGKSRFAPPEPFWPGPGEVIDATLPGPACPQLQGALPPFFSSVDEISEDCLHLRISRPVNVGPKDKLPVVVWLYGGGVVKGSSTDDHFNPEHVIKLSVSDGMPVIFASLNYRMSIFGFARSSTLKDQKSLNNGMRDQRLGLQWIKNNIMDFGGDPERITVYGLSAGGTFTSLQVLAYGGATGVPFQQAWMMSGPPGTALNITSDATTLHTLAVAENVGCGSLSDAEMIECLQNLSMRDLLHTAMEYSIANHPPHGLFTFIPSVDGDFIPDRHSNLIETGKFAKGIRMVFGWTQDDGAANVGLGNLIQTEEDMIAPLKNFAHALSPDQLDTLFSLYPPSSFYEELENYEARKAPTDPIVTVHYFRISRILRDVLFTCSSIDFGYQVVKHTRSMDPDFSGVRVYDLNQSVLSPLFAAAGLPYIGVAHGSDTNYIFNGVFPEGQMNAEDLELSLMFTRALINFAYTGDPVSNKSSEKQFGEWPVAFSNDLMETEGSSPASINIQVIGGPFETGPVYLKEETSNPFHPRDESEADSNLYWGVDRMQKILADVLGYGAMDSSKSKLRERQIEGEDLFKRCAYIKILSETLDV